LELLVFFFAVQSKIIKKYRGIFSGTSKEENRLSKYHWIPIRHNVAESGVFNKEGYTPYESVGRENLHNVLVRLDIKALELEESKPKKKNKIN